MPILYWHIDPTLLEEAEHNYRTDFALRLANKDALSIVRELTFDGVVPSITIGDVKNLFNRISHRFLKKPFSGVGIEVGAGPLTFSSVLAQFPQVTKIYGVEICKPIVERLYPKISESVAGSNADKVVGVVGSFDEMDLRDASVDFAFDFFSLHHSLDITVTLKEIARVLKPGGFLLMLDKARPNSHTEADLEELLNQDYGPDFKRQFGLPTDQLLTRRMNGEREYRLKDWQAALRSAGFRDIQHWNLQQTSGGSRLWQWVKNLCALLPPALQVKITPLLPGSKRKHKYTLETEHRVFVRELNPFRKETSLLVAYK